MRRSGPQAGEVDPELRLAALLPQDPLVAEQLARRLRLSNAQRDRLVAAVGVEPPLAASMPPLQARQALYRLGAQAFSDRVKLAWAAAPEAGETSAWLALLALARGWVRPRLGVSGLDAIAAGAPAGPLVGQALREVEDWWISADFPKDRGQALERLKAVIEDMAP